MNSNNTSSNNINDAEFDKMLDEHFSNDSAVKKGISNLLKAQNPTFQTKRMDAWKKVIESDKWKEEAKLRGKKRKENIEIKKKQQEHIRNLNQDPELKKIRHKSIKETWSKEEKKEEHSIRMKEVYSKSDAAQKRANKRKIPLISYEGLIFSHRAEAAEHYSKIWKIKASSASEKILRLIRTPESNWKYISQEEYIILTGNDPF